MSKIALFQKKKAQTAVKKETEFTTICILLGLSVVFFLLSFIAPKDYISTLETIRFLTLAFTAFVMPWLLSAGKEPPRTDLVSLLLSPLALGSVLLPTVPLDVALKTMSALVLTELGTLLTRHFEAKSLEKIVPVLINILVFFSWFGIVTIYQGAIAIVLTLTIVMAMFQNTTECLRAIETAIENVFVIALGIAKLVARLDPTNNLTEETAESSCFYVL